MKKILKDRFVWGIVALFVALVMYTWFQDIGKVSWMYSSTAMPITDSVIDLILVLSIAILGACRFHPRGGLIAGLAGSLVVI